MRTVSYEVFEGPQRITVIPGTYSPPSAKRVITRYPDDQSERIEKYSVQSSLKRSPNVRRYSYKSPPEQQLALRSRSPERARETKTIEIVSRSSSPARSEIPEPASILRRTTRTTKTSTTTPATENPEKGKFLTHRSAASHSRNPTSALKGTFYFAYNSHISPSQLRKDILYSSSSTPIALAKLPNHTWYIASNGQPNITPCPPTSNQKTSHPSTTVWGLLYNLNPSSEILLDIHHEINPSISHVHSNPKAKPNPHAFTKSYPSIQIEKWFVNPSDQTHKHDPFQVNTLIYSLHHPSPPGRINDILFPTLSHSANVAIEYGVPKSWLKNMMGQYGIRIRNRGDIVCEVHEEVAGASSANTSTSSKASEAGGSSDTESESEVVKQTYKKKVSVEVEKVSSDFY